MKIHEFTVVPIEIGEDAMEDAQHNLKHSGEVADNKEQPKLDNSYEWTDELISDQYDNPKLWIYFVDTSVCFVLYGQSNFSRDSAHLSFQAPTEKYTIEEVVNEVRDRRKCIESGIENPKSPSFQLANIYEKMENTDQWIQPPTTAYSFTFYVLEVDVLEIDGKFDDEVSQTIHALAHSRSSDVEVFVSEAIDRPIFGAQSNAEAIKYFDPYRNIIGLATWSSFVLAANTQEDLKEAKKLLLRGEITLQVAWNRCNFLTNKGREIFEKVPKAVEIQEYLRVALSAKLLPQQALLSTASGFQRRVIDYISNTSRLENEIASLSQVTDLLKNELEETLNHRRELGQSWIAIMLALFASVGVTDVLTNDWGNVLLYSGVGVFVAFIVACFTLGTVAYCSPWHQRRKRKDERQAKRRKS